MHFSSLNAMFIVQAIQDDITVIFSLKHAVSIFKKFGKIVETWALQKLTLQ